MKKRFNAGIVGLGSYFPARSVSNKELEKLIDTSDEWIKTKTGIRSRRFIASHKALSDLLIPAAKKALKDADTKSEDVDVIIVGAMSHDYMASILTGNIVKKAIGAKNAFAIDLNIICAGFIYSTELGASLIESGRAKTVLIVHGEVFSKYPHSRVTSVIFGDGAGAIVLKRVKQGLGFLNSYIGSNAEGAENLGIFVGGSKKLITPESFENGELQIYMNGKEIYKFAIEKFSESVNKVLEKEKLKIKDIDYVFSHQANLNIIKQGLASLGLPMNKTLTNIHKYGNIGGGSLITVLDEAKKKGLLKRGNLIVNVAYGAGLAWGANIMRWCDKRDVIGE